MSADAPAIPILQFRAGALTCAVAARDVVAVRAGASDRPPLWRLLGVPAADEAESAGTWLLGLGHGHAFADVLVQGPIEIEDVAAGEVLRRPPALVLPNNDLVFGFVRRARGLVVLLDIPTLVELASQQKWP